MRERNRRAREYSRLCRIRRWNRRLWAVAIFLWVMLLAFLAWCLTLPEVEDDVVQSRTILPITPPEADNETERTAQVDVVKAMVKWE